MKGLIFRLNNFFIAIVVTGLIIGCKRKVHVLKSPPHYNFSTVFIDKLDLKIKEISGIAWDKDRNVFIVHNDESGKVFFLNKETKIVQTEVTFGGKGDYEDVAVANGSIYVLRSDGLITKVMQDSTGKGYGVEVGDLDISGSKDFEAMYYDDIRKALIIICKNCAMDSKSTVSAFAFYPDSIGFDPKPVYTINADEIRNLSPKKTSKFQPSAVAIHPVLNKLFIVSSASNLLVIADRDGNVESVYYLSPKLFPQPEGIAFKQNGDMYISNEGVTAKSTLLKFVYKP
ncbi:MAG: SdiA-regulated domain-containing protein [Chitinophagaceae bacterium]